MWWTTRRQLNIADARREEPALSDRSISGAWIDTAERRLDAAAASNRADATRLVRENLESQRSAVSASVDEESINLLSFQRQVPGVGAVHLGGGRDDADAAVADLGTVESKRRASNSRVPIPAERPVKRREGTPVWRPPPRPFEVNRCRRSPPT